MKFIPTKIEGLTIVEVENFEDSRGYFFESYNEASFKAAGINAHFVQDNQSKSQFGVIRGLHAQDGEYAQAKLVRVLEGAVLDIAVDIREESPTFGEYFSIELSAENKRQLFIPRGFLHGFSVLTQSAVFAYKCDNLYHKAAEIGVRYDDETLDIDWQIATKDAIISAKDIELKGLDDVPHYRS